MADRLRGGRRADAQGQDQPGAGLAGAPVVAERRRSEPVRDRSRRRSSAATTSCACSRTCSTRPSRERRARLVSVIGPGRDRQDAAWRGSSSSTSTAWSTTVLLPRRPLAGLRRRDQLLGARRDGPAASRPARDRRRADDPREGRRDARELRPRRGRAALDRAGAAGAPRGRGVDGRIGAAVRRLADVLRAARRDGARWRMVFEDLPLRRLGPARLRRPPPRMEPERPDLRRHPVASRAPRAAPGLGRRQAQLHLALPRAARPSRRCASSSPASSRDFRRRP